MAKRRASLALLCSVALFLLAGCSSALRTAAVNALGDAMASGSSTYASDDDPELVAQAIPFGLKTMEALLAESPRHEELLVAAAAGFTQYAYAFVQLEADYAEARDLARATQMRARARKLYRRALDYGLRSLEVRHEGFRERLRAGETSLLPSLTARDVPLLYWTGAPWAALISLSKEDSELTADQGLVEAMMNRALALDESFGRGSIHDFFISWDGGRPASAGGSRERARWHLERAVEISRGERAAPWVSYAESVTVGQQDRRAFVEALEKALAVDPAKVPGLRLVNLVSQKRALWLISRSDELFLE